jgi:hypothetical protein
VIVRSSGRTSENHGRQSRAKLAIKVDLRVSLRAGDLMPALLGSFGAVPAARHLTTSVIPSTWPAPRNGKIIGVAVHSVPGAADDPDRALLIVHSDTVWGCLEDHLDLMDVFAQAYSDR